MIDHRTPYLDLPLPSRQNLLKEDVDRLRNAITEIDAHLGAIEQALAAPSGIATLDAQGRVPAAQLPEVLFGAVSYQGGWDAAANSPAIPAATNNNKGHYYLVTASGSTAISGKSVWLQGDWIISNGSTWDRVANSEVFDATAIATGVFALERIPALPISRVTGLQGALDGKFNTSGGTITGDITAYRPASPGTGCVFLGNSGGRYLFFDGTNYTLGGAGTIFHTGNFNPASYMPLTGGNFSGGIGIYNTAPTIMFYDTDWGPRQLHHNGGLFGFLNSAGGWAAYSSDDGSWVASGNIGAYSDRKHKDNICTIEDALELVENLRGVRYTDKRTGKERVGVVAQEVLEHLPEVVGEGEDGLHVDYGNIAGPLIEAVKVLATRVRALEAR